MKVNIKQRLLLALAALILLPVFVLPVWTISLTAPQYPDGMGMYIGVSEVWGHDEHDIQNINILNHYIGMKPIDPDGIPELDLFPPILAGIIAAGLLAAVIGRRWALTLWLVGLVGLGTAGMVDFYMWLIDYGHNLDPRAAIKIPGMTYTPPLIGTKQLLNITASSWPAIGSLFIALSIGLAAWALGSSYRQTRKEDDPVTPDPAPEAAASPRIAAPALVVVFAAAVLGAAALAGCADPPTAAAPTDAASGERMVYGESSDPYCGEIVQRVRWGGEIVTRQGETIRFRSVECMAGYVLENRTPAGEIAAIRAVDFPDGWRLIDVKEARFLHTPNLASPARRHLNVMAISTEKLARSLQEAYAGPLLDWDAVLHTVATEWGLQPPAQCPLHAAMAVNR